MPSELVDAAAQSGADAIKLQTYTADTMTLDVEGAGFVISDPNSLWKGRRLHDLYEEAHTPWDWHGKIMERAASHGLHCFSSPFDESAVDFLETLEVPAYKIASFEITDLRLIRKVAGTGKPMIISTGMATIEEIEEAIATARSAGCGNLVLLKCTSTYPASPVNSNVLTIPHLRATFGLEVGLSDHTMGFGAAVAAVAHGASVVEKHFTLSRSEGGVDSAFSLEPAEFAMLRVETERAWQSLGAVRFGPTEAERDSLVFRRSLYVAKDIEAGEAFTPQNLRIVRPGNGLHPRFYGEVIGRRATRDAKKGTPVDWSLVT